MKFKLFILLYACTFSLLAQNQKNVLSQSKWQFKSNKTFLTWMDAHVPGNVHTDLLKLNKIPNPHIGTNENELLWIAEEDWTYQTSLQITGEDLLQYNFCLSITDSDELKQNRRTCAYSILCENSRYCVDYNQNISHMTSLPKD
jgi:beta-mannosidase